jgi:predicted RND superfamily exporter protein
VAARGADSGATLESQLATAFEPTAFSGLTTAIGFLAVGSVRIDAIEQLGNYGALGVLFVLAASLTIVPSVLALRPLQVAAPRFEDGGLMAVLWLLMAGLCAFGFTRISIETDATRWFAPGSEVRDSYDRIRENLAGISPMNVVIRATRGVVTEPGTLAAIDRLTTYLNGLPEMGKAIAVTDPLRQLNAGFSGQSDAGVPETSELIEQFLMLLESVEYLPDLLSVDRKSANVALRLDDNGSESLLAVAALAEDWWKKNGPAGTEARATGIMFEFARAEDEIAFGQLRGFSWALVVILGLMFAVYRTARLAALAMIPDVLPLVIVFGFLGLAGIPMDAGIVVTGSLILGMAVDDTLHMVSAWQENVHAGQDAETALLSALRQVLAPVILTTVVIGIGFSVLIFADFVFVRNLGILVMVEMLVCLLGDIIFLPALLLRLGIRAEH